ncbi:hypothetical protein EMGBS3_07150 [Anaerolineaceae bacterium]|nr:hypothetical protein EMGBS3_07150 [Anaerolineaceae bacterium]
MAYWAVGWQMMRTDTPWISALMLALVPSDICEHDSCRDPVLNLTEV